MARLKRDCSRRRMGNSLNNMNHLECIRNAWTIIVRNKVRSFLTMLGIIIGVMAVVVIMSVGAGAQSLILNQIKSMGSNLVGVLPGKSEEKGPPTAVFGILITTLTYEDGRALTTGDNPHIKGAATYVKGVDTVVVGDTQLNTNFVGTTASYPQVEDTAIASGHFFTEEEERSMARVAVLGSDVASELFGDMDPIGVQIKIKRTLFTIIGIMRPRGVSGFQNQDNQIFVPVTTAQKLLLGIDYVSFMRVKVDSADYVEDVKEYMATVLRERHNIDSPESDDFTIRSSDEGLDALISVTNALRFFLAAVASIALVVGGFGIMNIMLAAVQERTKEIGLRKAVGAKHADITLQFLIETVTITFIGGIIGIILGAAISFIVAKVAQGLGYSWDLAIPLPSQIMASGLSIAIGAIFGITPARRASRLSPIEALRYE